MTGVVNNLGARSGIVGTTVGTGGSTSASDLDSGTLATARMAAGTVTNVWRFSDSSSGTLNLHAATATVATDARVFAVISGRHYLITGMQHMSPYRYAGTHNVRYQECRLYWDTADKALGDTSSLGTMIFGSNIGRRIVGTSDTGAESRILWSYNAWVTAASTTTYYTYTVCLTEGSDHQARAYNSGDSPHITIIYEVLP